MNFLKISTTKIELCIIRVRISRMLKEQVLYLQEALNKAPKGRIFRHLSRLGLYKSRLHTFQTNFPLKKIKMRTRVSGRTYESCNATHRKQESDPLKGSIRSLKILKKGQSGSLANLLTPLNKSNPFTSSPGVSEITISGPKNSCHIVILWALPQLLRRDLN